jgi:CRISPR-associated protein Cmr3
VAELDRRQEKTEQAVADGDLDRAAAINRTPVDRVVGFEPRATPKPPARRVWRDFPVDALPPTLRAWVSGTAEDMQVDPSMIAMPLLGAFAGFIGTTVSVKLTRNWSEPVALWIGLVAPSGSKKTPAMKAALRPFRTIAAEHFRAAQRENKGRKPDEQVRPERRFVDDSTPEALLALLAENPRGLLAHRDELAEMIANFGRFKAGKNAGLGEASQSCRLFDGSPTEIDRRSTGHAHIPRPLLSIVGAFPTKTLRALFDEKLQDNGLFPRFVLFKPPTKPAEFSFDDSDWRNDAALDRLARLVDGIKSRIDEKTGAPAPIDLELDADAKVLWKAQHDRLSREAHERPEGLAASATSKAAGLFLRVAVILHVLDQLESTVDEPTEAIEGNPAIGGETMVRAIELAAWMHEERLRVFANLASDAAVEMTHSVIDAIDWARFPGGITARELFDSRKGRFRDAEDAEITLRKATELGRLVESYGVRGDPAKGGRETLFFRPADSCASETPSQADAEGGFEVDRD